MNGITVVAEYYCSAFEPARVIMAYVVWTIGIVTLFWMSRFIFTDAKERTRARCIMSVPFAVVAILAAFESYNSYMNQWTEYDVVVSDSVSYNEFTSKYEVISENEGILRVIYK